MAQINILLKLLNALGVNINPATEDTLAARLDITLSQLRDAIKGSNTLTDLYTKLSTIDSDTLQLVTLLTTVSGQLPTSLGQKASAASLAAVLSTEQQALLANGQTLIKSTQLANAATDNLIYTPANGKKIRLHFFGYSAGVGVSGVLAKMKLEGYNANNAFDSQYLSAAGQPYARNIQAGKRYIEGAVGNAGGTAGRLFVNLDVAQSVNVNYELEEV